MGSESVTALCKVERNLTIHSPIQEGFPVSDGPGSQPSSLNNNRQQGCVRTKEYIRIS